jgi:uncharacterized protein YukJ
MFKDGPDGSREFESAINAKSTDRDSRLVYWFDQTFDKPALTDRLKELDFGFQPIQPHDPQFGDLGLDYLRGQLFVLDEGAVLPSDVDGPNNDIIDKLSPILQSSIDNQATIYLFGSQYSGRDGIHDVHMNQGSLGSFSKDDGVMTDGGLIVYFPNTEHWEAVFLAFASQRIPTDDHTGKPLRHSETLASRLE